MWIQRARESWQWRILNDLSTAFWVMAAISAFLSFVAGRAAMLHGKPLEVVLLYGSGVFAFSFVTFYLCVLGWHSIVRKKGNLWLEFFEQTLRVHNGNSEPVFNVMVKIPEDGSLFQSDLIARINGNAFVQCQHNNRPVTRTRIEEAIVNGILGEQIPHTGNAPVLISYRERTHRIREFRLQIRSQNGLQFFLADRLK